jgi:hypothetical protein
MLKTKGHAEFERWWKEWVSRRTQTRIVDEPRPSGKKLELDIERTTDAASCNLAHEPDAA